ncbi:MAG: hypothetical protein ACREV7_06405 [Steroidobacteraceae bacterium]
MSAIDVPDIIYALVLGTMVIFGVKYIAGIFQAWALGANEKRYRILAERVVTAQSETQATLSALQADLSKVASSVAEIEEILKQVE